MSSFILSESGYTGFEDFQDVIDKFLGFVFLKIAVVNLV